VKREGKRTEEKKEEKEEDEDLFDNLDGFEIKSGAEL